MGILPGEPSHALTLSSKEFVVFFFCVSDANDEVTTKKSKKSKSARVLAITQSG